VHANAPSSAARNPWLWVPSLYFAQALPNVMVVTVSVFAYTRMGLSAVVIGYTAWLSLPWMLKPLWSPIVELYATERRWTWAMQFVSAAALAIVALGYRSEQFLLWTVVGYALLAFASATHDIAADGFYMRALSAHDQTWFAGMRNVFFRVGVIFGEGLLLGVAGRLMTNKFEPSTAWALTHGLTAAVLGLLATYHLVMMPTLAPKVRDEAASLGQALRDALGIFRRYFAAIPLGVALPFLLFYRFAEAQLAKFAGKFLIDPRSAGGLELLEEQVGWINGVFGILALLAGGVLGGIVAARFGLRRCLPWMAVLLNVPNLVYVALAFYQPESLTTIGLGVVVEKFGYGFGFTGYMLYLLYLAQGEYRTSFYAIGTGFMTLGLIFPQSLAGYLLQSMGYESFFLWVMVATIPSFIVTAMIYRHVDPQFGLKEGAA
jgi:PAT family beta-lactamase induction signal transducer AmpG